MPAAARAVARDGFRIGWLTISTSPPRTLALKSSPSAVTRSSCASPVALLLTPDTRRLTDVTTSSRPLPARSRHYSESLINPRACSQTRTPEWAFREITQLSASLASLARMADAKSS